MIKPKELNNLQLLHLFEEKVCCESKCEPYNGWHDKDCPVAETDEEKVKLASLRLELIKRMKNFNG